MSSMYEDADDGWLILLWYWSNIIKSHLVWTFGFLLPGSRPKDGIPSPGQLEDALAPEKVDLPFTKTHSIPVIFIMVFLPVSSLKSELKGQVDTIHEACVLEMEKELSNGTEWVRC